MRPPLVVLALAFVISAAFAAVARADERPLLGAADVRFLEARGWLQRDDARALRVLGAYAPRVTSAEGVRLPDVRLARIEALECALGRVAARRLGVAQFFSDALFRGGAASPVVLVDRATLDSLDRLFDLHTIFPPTVAAPVPGGFVHMMFLLAGQARVVISYDGRATYAHPDDAYSIFGNRDYQVYPFLRMTVGLRDGAPALLDLGVSDGPHAPLGPFQKRVLLLRPTIRSLFVHGRDVTADTSIINRKITPPPIDWRAGPADGRRRLNELGCPADGLWAAPEPGTGTAAAPSTPAAGGGAAATRAADAPAH
jgi:hypothetical protein